MKGGVDGSGRSRRVELMLLDWTRGAEAALIRRYPRLSLRAMYGIEVKESFGISTIIH